MQEVRGSSPLSSTFGIGGDTIGANELRDRFGYRIEQASLGRDVLVTRGGKPLFRLPSAVPQLRLVEGGDARAA